MGLATLSSRGPKTFRVKVFQVFEREADGGI